MVNDPSVPEVVSRSFVFGERALLNLFRGAGGLLGSSGGGGGSGLDTLNSLLQSAFQDYFWSSQVFDSYTGDIFSFQEIGSQQAQAFNAQFDQVAALGIVGYSAGGLSAIRVARGQAPQAVDLVVQLDSYDPLTGSSVEDEILPVNVVKGINYYQVANRFNPFRPGFDPFDLQGARVVQGAENINAEDLLGDRGITHRTLDDSPGLQSQILRDIEVNVLQDLKFDRAGQLSLGGGAQLTNNILALTADASGGVGRALIGDTFAIDADFSFQTRFEFRLPAVDSPGVSFWIEPVGEALVSQSSLAVAFEPLAFEAAALNANAIALLTPDLAPVPLAQAQTPLDLDSGQPLTAWVDYDGLTNELAIFLGDTLTQPSTPVLSYGLDLPAITGSQATFGFQATVQGAERQSELLSWQLNTTGRSGHEPPDEWGDHDCGVDWAFLRSLVELGGSALNELGVEVFDGRVAQTVQEVVDTLTTGWLPFSLNDFSGAIEQVLTDSRVNWPVEGTKSANGDMIGAAIAGADWQSVGGKADIFDNPDLATLGQTEQGQRVIDDMVSWAQGLVDTYPALSAGCLSPPGAPAALLG
ncbi:hypothetical protein IQ254_27915 [Nodosilinea sp. LEGE 07088]|uniref:hypothetical protein n=1 Tax=Nodosilinea sp. LEGE 07088 TaxID=2777968 RepID=UPI00187E9D58|nr:hypothetical protein [Nodosilinea sp. LEGE 07088]MBE9140982.1 hypothetical protein [Nodosilinea sp. LEGE 07088]